MCLAAFALDSNRRFPLVVAANRDEFFQRPALPLSWWAPEGRTELILGGRDLAAGGTWMGLTAAGRFALVTNVRRADLPPPGDAPSRGLIVPDWLLSAQPADRFWARIALSGYAPFNLIAADFRQGECFWATSQAFGGRRLSRGVTVISNAAELDAHWPKVQQLKRRVSLELSAASEATTVDKLASRLFAMLADGTPAPDESLPHTGLDIERERQLSSAFIHTPDGRYGTRCSTLVIAERHGSQLTTHVIERSYSSQGASEPDRAVTVPDWPPAHAAPVGPDEAHPSLGGRKRRHRNLLIEPWQ